MPEGCDYCGEAEHLSCDNCGEAPVFNRVRCGFCGHFVCEIHAMHVGDAREAAGLPRHEEDEGGPVLGDDEPAMSPCGTCGGTGAVPEARGEGAPPEWRGEFRCSTCGGSGQEPASSPDRCPRSAR